MSWGSYAQNATTMLSKLLNETDFTDVTLVCDGGQYIKAHKVILSGCSYFFSNFLKTITHQHPVIYLAGIIFEDLQAILELIYLGKTKVVQDNLDNFVKTADKLKIIGLTDDVDISVKDTEKPPKIDLMQQRGHKILESKVPEQIKAEQVDDKCTQARSERTSSMWQPQLDKLKRPDLPLLFCKKCPYTTYNSEVLEVHMTHYHAPQYTCDNCSFKAHTPESLKNHNTRKPCGKVSLYCNKCGSQYKNKDALDRHEKVCTADSDSSRKL